MTQHLTLNPSKTPLSSCWRGAGGEVIVIGALKTRQEQLDALKFVEEKGLVTIADVTSGLRFLKHPLLDHSRDFSNLDLSKALRLGGRLVCIPPFAKADGRIAKIISRTDWRKYALFLGNSLPIREMDAHAIAGEHIPLVGANRGASGIDGIISTACGFALGARQSLVLYLGDMTFLHDVNGLSFLKDIPTQLIMVVLNNHGNGIFKQLPIAKEKNLFERYFLVPHEYNLSGACQIYNVKHQTVQTPEAFEVSYLAALESGETQVIEVHSF